MTGALDYCHRCLSYFHGTDSHPRSWRKPKGSRKPKPKGRRPSW